MYYFIKEIWGGLGNSLQVRTWFLLSLSMLDETTMD